MILTIILIISLVTFALLLLAGLTISMALYRSLLVFMILFAVFYFSMYMIKLIRENNSTE
ncbi:MAG: hypothetical protein CL672_08315 [Balneola sp.]|nr:hypothetical protein [Balneola sp.]